MAESAAKRFLAIVQFRSDSTPTRIRDDAPTIIEFIKRISNGSTNLRSAPPMVFSSGILSKPTNRPVPSKAISWAARDQEMAMAFFSSRSEFSSQRQVL